MLLVTMNNIINVYSFNSFFLVYNLSFEGSKTLMNWRLFGISNNDTLAACKSSL